VLRGLELQLLVIVWRKFRLWRRRRWGLTKREYLQLATIAILRQASCSERGVGGEWAATTALSAWNKIEQFCERDDARERQKEREVTT
jgi:hypothetical protein